LRRDSPLSDDRIDVLRVLLARFVELAMVDNDVGDLKVAVQALNELTEASTLFSQWRDVPKLAIFGSARTDVANPLYEMARQLGATMAQRGWMIISGAGPGIMEASAMGAGRDHTLGVNIELPFEQFSNPYIDAESMLVAMQYFFTRKVAMTRPSNAFAMFPGGLGTMDETFEVLTLLHTGKTSPAPVVLVDTPDGDFWRQWLNFVDNAVTAGHYIDEPDMCLVRLCTSVEDAADEIDHFFSNYVRFDVRGDRGVIKVRRRVSDEQLAELANVVPRFATGLGYRRDDDTTISFAFDGRNYVNLRLLIDQINGWA
jgi:uncharacterized protein (TIGR00730 family)